MLDKIRLHAAGKLPADYVENMTDQTFTVLDGRCCRFLGVAHSELSAYVRTVGGTDAEILAWAEAHGKPRSDEECLVWSRFMTKLGWRDERSAVLQQRISAAGLAGRPIETIFDFLDFEEGRNPVRARSWEQKPALIIVLMGVAGSGKTTVGIELADTLGWRFCEADDFHPAANIAKMSAGLPLDDADRAPWLKAIHHQIETCLRNDESAVVTCSALKQSYREAIVVDPVRVKLVYLKGTQALLERRLAGRAGHFMKPEMLASQLAALEEPSDALTINIGATPAELVERIREAFNLP